MAPTLLTPMRARDSAEPHRTSSPLELFFDLVFVVAVSLTASSFAHEVEDGHALRGLGLFLLVFFAVWWAWLNFTWFASAYDTDDWLYRVMTFVQMAGALTVAAGVPTAFARESFTVVVVGYAMMRLAMVAQWLRAARGDPARRTTALTYAGGITGLQVLWFAALALPRSLVVPVFLLLVLGELAVPVLAEHRTPTSYHSGHVAERYGLFTIIVLGEGLLATASSVIEALQAGEHVPELVGLAAASLVLVAGMWWFYFAVDSAQQITELTGALRWGYGHYLVFAAAAAVSAGIEVQVAVIAEPGSPSATTARLVVAVPVALFVLGVWVIVLRPHLDRAADGACGVAAVVCLAAAFLPLPAVALTSTVALVLAGLVALLLLHGARAARVQSWAGSGAR